MRLFTRRLCDGESSSSDTVTRAVARFCRMAMHRRGGVLRSISQWRARIPKRISSTYWPRRHSATRLENPLAAPRRMIAASIQKQSDSGGGPLAQLLLRFGGLTTQDQGVGRAIHHRIQELLSEEAGIC